ncbi:hypothetical protein [Leptolyngbya sp. FACHB-16]|uniref:hypothetical protein n=1 Tax=unclassified Leptolyngbya TaxID=2650499 RepID=UPI00168451E4|nr:hypothetical protein [Leptolyngbya sp. FACHB-16]MBD2156239.1 hypothetical protein [Leptolyngbya sp. FACHB-16]
MAGNYTPVLGTGTTIKVALLPKGSTAEPVETSITLAALAAKDTTTPASITTPALATGVSIPENAYLAWEAENGQVVATKVVEAAEAADVAIAVDIIPRDIASGSIAAWPPELQIRTGVDLDRSSNEVTYVTLKSAFEQRVGVSIATGLNLPGYYNANDAAYKMLEFAQANQQFVYVIVEYPNQDPLAYSTGDIVKGVCSVTGLPKNAPADGLISADVTLGFAAPPVFADATPV